MALQARWRVHRAPLLTMEEFQRRRRVPNSFVSKVLSEIEGLVRSGKSRLKDAQTEGLSQDGRFDQMSAEQWRVLDQAHRKRNPAEYEGLLEVDRNLVEAIIRADEVATRVTALGPLNR
jgi:hypothetical protein